MYVLYICWPKSPDCSLCSASCVYTWHVLHRQRRWWCWWARTHRSRLTEGGGGVSCCLYWLRGKLCDCTHCLMASLTSCSSTGPPSSCLALTADWRPTAGSLCHSKFSWLVNTLTFPCTQWHTHFYFFQTRKGKKARWGLALGNKRLTMLNANSAQINVTWLCHCRLRVDNNFPLLYN